MSKGLKEQIIQSELERIKKAVSQNNWFFMERLENKKTLLKLGLTKRDIGSCILNLTAKDYYKGPEEDRNKSEGRVWIFLHPYSGCKIYIKVKLFKKQGNDYLNVLSFHD